MKARNVKGMVYPALGVGAGMLGNPKVAEVHPFLAKHPYLPPILLLLVALVLFSYKKARGFALGLGAVSLVFLVMAIWAKATGKIGVPGEEVVPTEPVERFEYWWETFTKRGEPSTHYPYY